MDITTFLILALANWRIASLIGNTEEHGPYDVLGKFRYWVGVRQIRGDEVEGKNEIAKAMICAWCSSIWIGIIQAIMWFTMPFSIWLFLPFALSAVAILFEEKR